MWWGIGDGGICEEEKVGEKEKKRKKKMFCELERENERGERKKDKIRVKVATVNFHIWKFTVAYFGWAFKVEALLEGENLTKVVKLNKMAILKHLLEML